MRIDHQLDEGQTTFTGYLVLEGILRPPGSSGGGGESSRPVKGSLVIYEAGWRVGAREVANWKVVEGSVKGELKGALRSEEGVGAVDGKEAWIELELKRG